MNALARSIAAVKRSAGARAACVAALILLPAAGPARAQPATATAPAAPAQPERNIAGPGDYGLREKIVQLLGRDKDMSKEKFRLILVNGGAVFSGEITSCAMKKRALTFAATVRGVINVTDEMTVTRGGAPDAELAKAVTGRLSDASEGLGLADLRVKVDDGVLTLDGTVQDVASRGRAEDMAGTVLGITRISNHLLPRNAPSGADDASLQKAALAYLGDFHQFAYPGDITVTIEQGVATLRGRVSLYMGRQQAGMVASLVRGVTRVDNRIKVDPSYQEGPRPRVAAQH